jgi:hypothetical protein
MVTPIALQDTQAIYGAALDDSYRNVLRAPEPSSPADWLLISLDLEIPATGIEASKYILASSNGSTGTFQLFTMSNRANGRIATAAGGFTVTNLFPAADYNKRITIHLLIDFVGQVGLVAKAVDGGAAMSFGVSSNNLTGVGTDMSLLFKSGIFLLGTSNVPANAVSAGVRRLLIHNGTGLAPAANFSKPIYNGGADWGGNGELLVGAYIAGSTPRYYWGFSLAQANGGSVLNRGTGGAYPFTPYWSAQSYPFRLKAGAPVVLTSSYSPITARVTGASTIYRTWNDIPMVVVGPNVIVDEPAPAPVYNESGIWNTGNFGPWPFVGYNRNQAVLNMGMGTTGQAGWVSTRQGIHNAAFPNIKSTDTPPNPVVMGGQGWLGHGSSSITQYDPALSTTFPYTFDTPGTLTFTVSEGSPLPNNPRSITRWMQPLVGLASPPTGPGLPFQRDPSVGTATAPRFYDNATDVDTSWWTTPSGTVPTEARPTSGGYGGGVAAAWSRAQQLVKTPFLAQLDSTFRDFMPTNQQSDYGADWNSTVAEIDFCCYYNLLTEAEQAWWVKACADVGQRLGDRWDGGGRQRGGVEPINYGGAASWMKWNVVKAAHTFRNAANATARNRLAVQSNRLLYDEWAEDKMFFYTSKLATETPNTGQSDGINGWVYHFFENEALFSINPTPQRVEYVSGLFDGNRTYYGPNNAGIMSSLIIAQKMGIFDTYMGHPARQRLLWNFYDWIRTMGIDHPSFSWHNYMTKFLAPVILAEWPTTFPYPTSAPTLLGTYAKGGNEQPDQVWFVFDHLLTSANPPTAADFIVRVNGVVQTPFVPNWLPELNGGGGSNGRRLPSWGTGPYFKFGSRMGVFLPPNTISAASVVDLQYTSNPARPARTVAFTPVGNVPRQTATNLMAGGSVA